MEWKFNDGDTAVFRCMDSDWNGPDTTRCTVIRKLTRYEADLCETGPMYKIKLEGRHGIVLDAFEDELVATN